jgi:hypothetical protein
MNASSERAMLAWVCAASLIAVGVVGWPDSNQPSTVAGVARRPAIDKGRRRVRDTTAQLQRADIRRSAVSESEPELESSGPHAQVELWRGRVVFADGSPACGAKVWYASGCAFSDANGVFEFPGVGEDEILQATLPGFQPGQEVLESRHGIVLQLGPPTLSLAGHIYARQGQEAQGWRIAVLDATLIEPVGLDCVTLERASSRAPARVQTSADGAFTIDGLSERPYTLAAWRGERERIELYVAAPAVPPQAPTEIHIPPANECRSVELHCRDANASPLACLRVGLPGTPPIATTDEEGRLLLTGSLPAQLVLVLTTPGGFVSYRDVDLSASADLVLESR